MYVYTFPPKINLSNSFCREAVESAKANAAPRRKASPNPVGCILRESQHIPGTYPRHPLSPPNIQEFRITKVLKGLQFCSKDMFGKLFANILQMLAKS